MSYIKRHPDPERIAALDGAEYAIFMRACELINTHPIEKDCPEDLFVAAFRIARRCGARGLNDYQGLRLVAMVAINRRATIDRLRAHPC